MVIRSYDLMVILIIYLFQVVIENQNNALEYDDIEVDQGSAVRQDMHFDKAGDHLYVMTSNKVSWPLASRAVMWRYECRKGLNIFFLLS